MAAIDGERLKKEISHVYKYCVPFYYTSVEEKKILWQCSACPKIKLEETVMCDGCQLWFHWYVHLYDYIFSFLSQNCNALTQQVLCQLQSR